jgi:hypothetical protein
MLEFVSHSVYLLHISSCLPATVLYFGDESLLRNWHAAAAHIRGVFKKRPNFLNSAPTSTEGALFKKFGLFLNMPRILKGSE